VVCQKMVAQPLAGGLSATHQGDGVALNAVTGGFNPKLSPYSKTC
jgi:hypothetical protein